MMLHSRLCSELTFENMHHTPRCVDERHDLDGVEGTALCVLGEGGVYVCVEESEKVRMCVYKESKRERESERERERQSE